MWWQVLLLVAAVVTPSLGFNCEMKALDAAEGCLKQAKAFYTNCGLKEVSPQDARPSDCADVQASGHTQSGVYSVWPRSRVLRGEALRVRCDMDTDGGGWTVFQRRGNFSRQEDFYRDWQAYKSGFGNLERDFWLGNDAIFALTNQGSYSLRVDLQAADGNRTYALYRDFWIDGETANYTLHVGGLITAARASTRPRGDIMDGHNGQMFTTKDRDNDETESFNCADHNHGGFWYDNCASCNPNGIYRPVGTPTSDTLYCGDFFNLVALDMKLKRL